MQATFAGSAHNDARAAGGDMIYSLRLLARMMRNRLRTMHIYNIFFKMYITHDSNDL